jgi:DNA-binding Xre family transcriptional regulator
VEALRVGERFEPEEASRIRAAVARVFAGCPKLRLAVVLFERAADEADLAEEMVVVTRAVRRMGRGWFSMVHRSELSRVLELLEVGGLEIAAGKLREEMLDRLACEEEGIPGWEAPLVERPPWEEPPPRKRKPR